MRPDYRTMFLEGLPAALRSDPYRLFFAEMLRVDPDFRALYMASSSGAASLGFDQSRLPEALLALQELPDDAGRPRVVEALARFRPPAAP